MMVNLGLRNRIGILHACAAACLLVCACGRSGGNGNTGPAIQVKGSDTMVNVAQAWAERYKKLFPMVEVEISGGGSGVGIAALTKGTIDIATASREIKKSEIAQIKENTGKESNDFIIGYDALAVYVNHRNPLDEISLPELERIFGLERTIRRWSQLGVSLPNSKHDEIIRISRQSSSGTYSFFRERVLHKQDFSLGSLDMNGSKEVVELVGFTPTAIGYSGMGYVTEQVKMLRLSEREGEQSYDPGVETTQNGTYPLARSLHLYTSGEPVGALKDFIDWILSSEGQRIVQECGYVPVHPPQQDDTDSAKGEPQI